jgi:hypothetical protein
MTPNRSLSLSYQVQNLMRSNLLQVIQPVFPFDIVKSFRSKKQNNTRDRIYNRENTLLSMIISAIHEDKSLQNSVNIIQEIHNRNIEHIKDYAKKVVEEEKDYDLKNNKSNKPGRPKLYKAHISKSKLQSVSSNTAAYSKARKRLDDELINEVFEKTKDFSDLAAIYKWKGLNVFITDGTYFQMQDTKELRKKYGTQKDSSGSLSAYPQGLLQGVIHQGTGSIFAYQIGTRQQSELELLFPLVEQIPQKTLLLADDLYNTYAIFTLLADRQIDIIVPGKRKRIYKVIETIDQEDQIVEITRTARPGWLPERYKLPEKLVLRRISYKDINHQGKGHILYTSILDKSIDKDEIIDKYTTRWDIEITIREIKTLMGMNIARSKTEAMVLKEFKVAIVAYNLIRKVIAQSTDGTAFSPEEDIIQKYIEANQIALVDKLGRVYNRWSPGRIPSANSKSK